MATWRNPLSMPRSLMGQLKPKHYTSSAILIPNGWLLLVQPPNYYLLHRSSSHSFYYHLFFFCVCDIIFLLLIIICVFFPSYNFHFVGFVCAGAVVRTDDGRSSESIKKCAIVCVRVWCVQLDENFRFCWFRIFPKTRSFTKHTTTAEEYVIENLIRCFWNIHFFRFCLFFY